MAGRRRYKVGEQKMYDKAFDLHNMGSPILNNSRNTSIMNCTTVTEMTTRRGLENLLQEWRGNDEGNFIKNGKKFPSKLKIAESALTKIDEQFQQSQQAQINSGRRPDNKMPPDMQTEKLRAEAVVDVCLAEISAIEKRLESFVDADTKRSSGDVLKHGPQGSGKMLGGVLSVIDGQDVKQDSKGVLRISDDRSPYDRMETADYFDFVVRPFLTERGQLINEKILEERAFVKGGGIPGSFAFNTQPPNPPWPENVKKETVK